MEDTTSNPYTDTEDLYRGENQEFAPDPASGSPAGEPKRKKKKLPLAIRSTLDRQFRNYVQLSVVGLFLALSFYFVLLYFMGFEQQLLLFAATILPFCVLGGAFFYIGHRIIEDLTTRTIINESLIVLIFLLTGYCFYFYYDLDDGWAIKVVTVAIMNGIMGAAAFTFSASKTAFNIAVPILVLPLFLYYSLVSTEIMEQILAGMYVIYVGVLSFLSRRDYNRRVALIQTQLSLEEEKELVIEQSHKLQHTLEEVHALKKQQDGDYFLTSLLLKPLGLNTVTLDTVEIQFEIRQKKTFQFKSWDTEIGGDICIAHEIELNAQKYAVFINADAMGKSMQGAGGAIVLGAVFQSLIERNRNSPVYQKQSPERWLKNSFLELQKVFESFDGSMLISVVIGLVDEKTGYMYYINAEHPYAILYRDGQARFLRDKVYYMKVGTPGLEGQVYLSGFQLQDGDIILVGSDGKDDIILGTDSDGNRVINEDEKQILKIAEENKCDLDGIVRSLEKIGPFSDDLSLLRLQYTAPRAEAENELEEDWGQSIARAESLMGEGETTKARTLLDALDYASVRRQESLAKLVKLFYQLENYQAAAHTAEQYSRQYPGELNYIFLASLSYGKLGDWQTALDLADRVRLRRPNHIPNLLHLAELQMKFHHRKKATEMLRYALELDPMNQRAREIQARYDLDIPEEN